MEQQHPVFIIYRREWLSEVTGYSRGYLSRVATGRIPVSRSFIERISHTLRKVLKDTVQNPEDKLFLPDQET